MSSAFRFVPTRASDPSSVISALSGAGITITPISELHNIINQDVENPITYVGVEAFESADTKLVAADSNGNHVFLFLYGRQTLIQLGRGLEALADRLAPYQSAVLVAGGSKRLRKSVERALMEW